LDSLRARSDGVHAFGYNSAERTDLDEIWSYLNTFSGLALADFGRDPRSSESGRARRKFVFFVR